MLARAAIIPGARVSRIVSGKFLVRVSVQKLLKLHKFFPTPKCRTSPAAKPQNLLSDNFK